jgi:hypothetical protein
MTVTMWLLEKIDNDDYASYFFITGPVSTEIILQRASLYRVQKKIGAVFSEENSCTTVCSLLCYSIRKHHM